MKRYILLIVIAVFGLSCKSQNEESKNELKSNAEIAEKMRPEGSWKVNKEFDEFGNLIRFDSIYSWSSFEGKENFSQKDIDSIFRGTNFNMFQNFGHFDFGAFDHNFLNDSIMNPRFKFDSFFNHNFGSQQEEMQKIIEKMQERHQKFFENNNDKSKEEIFRKPVN